MSVENMGNGYVKVGVKQEDLEESIAGLRPVSYTHLTLPTTSRV
mgnify:CR=1 FL=1